MYFKNTIIAIVAAVSALFCSSCGDNLTNSSGTLVLYTADTIKLSTNGVGILNLQNEGDYYSPYSNIRRIVIEYTGETNIDSAKGICHMIVKVAGQSGGSVPFYMDYNGITSINNTYSYNVVITPDINLWYAQFSVEINSGFTPDLKYIMIRNVKVTGQSD